MRVAIIGQGYVGLPLAIAAATAGHTVTGVDSDPDLVRNLSLCHSKIEDISDSQIQKAYDAGRYQASTSFDSVKDAEVTVICVPTPLDSSHNPDLSFLISAVSSVAQNYKEDSLIIVESTVSPGTTRGVVARILEKSKKNFYLAYSPERIDPANRKWNIRNTPKLVAGINDLSTSHAEKFYKTFIDTVVAGKSLEVIETAKLLENSFRLINISFINEIAEFCSKMKLNVREVIDAAATKPYGFMPFYPGAGIGGHCIPIDPSYLAAKAKEIGAPTRFIDLANQVNLSLSSYFVGVTTTMLGNLASKKILIVGIGYKADVSDIRESAAIRLINALRTAGAYVNWHDNLVKSWSNEVSSPIADEYDLAILVNPNRGTDLSSLGTTPVLDTRGETL